MSTSSWTRGGAGTHRCFACERSAAGCLSAGYRSVVAQGRVYFVAFPELVGTLLQDSWVLSVEVDDGQATFDLDLVLTPEHPAFRPQRPESTAVRESAPDTLR